MHIKNGSLSLCRSAAHLGEIKTGPDATASVVWTESGPLSGLPPLSGPM